MLRWLELRLQAFQNSSTLVSDYQARNALHSAGSAFTQIYANIRLHLTRRLFMERRSASSVLTETTVVKPPCREMKGQLGDGSSALCATLGSEGHSVSTARSTP